MRGSGLSWRAARWIISKILSPNLIPHRPGVCLNNGRCTWWINDRPRAITRKLIMSFLKPGKSYRDCNPSMWVKPLTFIPLIFVKVSRRSKGT